MISALVLTLNEEANLPRCLQSLAWCDDIVILDSLSTDKTVEIARSYGARVIQRPFDDWSTHQNWALRNISFRHSWVYYSDADEVMPWDLRDEIHSVASAGGQEVAYWVRYKNFFFDRWISHCGIYPVWVLRLFRPEAVTWERLVNPVPTVAGKAGHLTSHFLHHSFNKGMTAWFEKHNRYSSQEAVETIESLRIESVDWPGLLANSPTRRRRALKTLSFRLPGRPLLRFAYMYLVRRGFLDGRAGFHYCLLLAIYEYMIVIKIEEARRRKNGQSI